MLLSSLMAFFGVWGLSRLPLFYFPAFKIPRFRRVTDDGYFLIIEARDPHFHVTRRGNFCWTPTPQPWKRSQNEGGLKIEN